MTLDYKYGQAAAIHRNHRSRCLGNSWTCALDAAALITGRPAVEFADAVNYCGDRMVPHTAEYVGHNHVGYSWLDLHHALSIKAIPHMLVLAEYDMELYPIGAVKMKVPLKSLLHNRKGILFDDSHAYVVLGDNLSRDVHGLYFPQSVPHAAIVFEPDAELMKRLHEIQYRSIVT